MIDDSFDRCRDEVLVVFYFYKAIFICAIFKKVFTACFELPDNKYEITLWVRMIVNL
jgi:hypothetical protein